MKQFLFVFIFMISQVIACAQDSSFVVVDTIKGPTFKAWVFQNTSFFSKPAGKGYIAAVQDSAVFLTKNETVLMQAASIANLRRMDYHVIQSIRVGKPAKNGKYILLGAVLGITAGAVIGALGGDDQGWFAMTAEEKALVGGFIGICVGTLAAALISKQPRKTYLINGDWKNLEDMKAMLLKE